MSKKVRKIKRKVASAAEKEAFYNAMCTEWLTDLETKTLCGQPICYEDAHMVAYNLLDSIEARMLQLGYKPQDLPTYKRRLGGQTKATAGNFTECRRCCLTKQDENGDWYCEALWVGENKERFYTADGDGCARGIPRSEYR